MNTENSEDTKLLMTFPEAGAKLGISGEAFRRRVYRGQFKECVLKIGRTYYVEPEAFKQYIRKRTGKIFARAKPRADDL